MGRGVRREGVRRLKMSHQEYQLGISELTISMAFCISYTIFSQTLCISYYQAYMISVFTETSIT